MMLLIAKLTLLLLGAALMASGVVQGSWPLISVPKNLPTKMISKYVSTDDPSLGYDGDRVTLGHTGINEVLPWWMLDMLQTYIVKRVDFYQRTSHNYGFARSQFVTIGISSQQQVWNNFNVNLFETCFFNPNPVVAGVDPLNFTCYRPISGRYLTVYRDLNNKGVRDTDMMINFAEIDIYAYQKSNSAAPMMVLEAAQPASTSINSLVASMTVRSDIECAVLCSASVECMHIMVSYNTSTGVTQCHLLRSFSLPGNSIGVGAAKFYSYNLV